MQSSVISGFGVPENTPSHPDSLTENVQFTVQPLAAQPPKSSPPTRRLVRPSTPGISKSESDVSLASKLESLHLQQSSLASNFQEIQSRLADLERAAERINRAFAHLSHIHAVLQGQEGPGNRNQPGGFSRRGYSNNRSNYRHSENINNLRGGRRNGSDRDPSQPNYFPNGREF